MNPFQRLQELASQMYLEPAEDANCPKLEEAPGSLSGMISQAALPNGNRVKLLKTLLTSACERDCYYCPFRAGRNYRRTTLKPEEMAKTFMALHRGHAVEGLFLSSGIVAGGMRTQDKMIDTAEILRNKLGYKGYLHLKIMPGAERDQVLRAMQLADRVSINLEAPNLDRLSRLAPSKDFFDELLQPLRWVDEIRRTNPSNLGWNGRWPSSVTQFVVGAVGESDLELLSTTEKLYRQLGLSRTYYSTFSPLEDTPLENLPPTDPKRGFRLYQASFLVRDYGFSVEDMPFEPTGNLPLQIDPKQAWAQTNLSGSPIEINNASRSELLRIPGIGPKSATAILNARYHGKLKNFDDLRRLGLNPTRAIAYILLDGRRPSQQLALF
jgi:predicted DNA-binding helix-hairpin-helix protein